MYQKGVWKSVYEHDLDEVIVTQDNLHSYDGITDIAFWELKKDITKIRAMHKNKEQHYGN